MALPPSAPAVNAMVMVALPGVTVTPVGTDGVVRGVTVAEDDAVPAPAPMDAVPALPGEGTLPPAEDGATESLVE